MDAVTPLDCSREKFAPIVDTVFTSIYGVSSAVYVSAGTVLAVSTDDGWNRMFGAMMVGAGVVAAAIATPFLFSARSGYRDVAACRRTHERRRLLYGIQQP